MSHVQENVQISNSLNEKQQQAYLIVIQGNEKIVLLLGEAWHR